MKKPAETALAIGADYRQFIEALKTRVVSARISATPKRKPTTSHSPCQSTPAQGPQRESGVGASDGFGE